MSALSRFARDLSVLQLKFHPKTKMLTPRLSTVQHCPSCSLSLRAAPRFAVDHAGLEQE